MAPQRWLLRIALWSIPLPWIAAELSRVVAEYGRQPWKISGVLPTFSGRLDAGSARDVYWSLAGFVGFYTLLLIVELYLMFKYARKGPSSLETGAYYFEKTAWIFDYETLKRIWWVLLGVLLIGFAVTDGFDMGVGLLLPFLGRTDAERRVIINSIGPTWEGNQTWLITAAGANVCRMAAGVCRVVLRHVRCDAAGAVRAVFPTGRFRLSKQGHRSALAQRMGLGAVRRRRGAGAGVRRRLRQSAAGRALPFR